MPKKTPKATIDMPAPVAPEDKKGKSTAEHPVATCWVTCENARLGNDGDLPERRDLHLACMAAGVAYYTTRTQVQRYLRWHKDGRAEGDLPRGVVLAD